MTRSGVAGLLSRRSTLASSVSLALHGGVVLVGVALVGTRVARSPRLIELTSVEVVSAVPVPLPLAAAPEPAAPVAAAAPPSPATAAPARPSPPAPAAPRAATAREALDLQVRYDDPDSFASKRSEEAAEGEHHGIEGARGIRADSRRQLQDSLAGLQMPAPPPVSIARPPRARRDYHRLKLHSVRKFAGLTIKLRLTVDAQGRVSDVELVEGIDGQIDRRVVELARHFEFDPARDEVGEPVAGISKWNIEIIDDDGGQYRNALERGYY